MEHSRSWWGSQLVVSTHASIEAKSHMLPPDGLKISAMASEDQRPWPCGVERAPPSGKTKSSIRLSLQFTSTSSSFVPAPPALRTSLHLHPHNACVKDFQPQNSMPSGNSATCMRAEIAHPEQSDISSLLMLGTVAGSLNDIMYASIATSTDSMRARSKFVQDGVVNSKVLCCVESPSSDDPFHTLNVTWRYHSLSEPRDYTCIEATGLLPNDYGELVGFHLVHSLDFAQLPVYRNYGVERANMSVCTFFRQKTSTLVECYTRGYFDFHSNNEMLNNISLHTISTQWLSMARYVECAQMKKLVWWMRIRTGRDSFASSSQSSSSTSSGGIAGIRQHSRPKVQAGTRCRVCNRGFGGFMRTTPRACACCAEWVCKRCCVKKQVCVVSSHNKSKVNDKKLVFCAQCIAEGAKSDAALILREELLGHRSSYSSTRRTTMETMETFDGTESAADI